MTTTKQKPRK